MNYFTVILLGTAVVLAASAPVDLDAKYPFSSVLYDSNGQYYGLYWNFTIATESIYFAVNVSTTGWVGFGLSPNGMMPASDVVIGWVSGGQAYFHDRYAEGRFLPPIDTLSQDWFLVNSEEENGYTVLEFSRNFTTCDPQDLDITSSTARVVWSYSTTDPTDSSGAGARQHDFIGSRSINLISGLPNRDPTPLGNEPSLAIVVSDVTIPGASTTYYCESFRLPDPLVNTTHYINRFSPVLTTHNYTYVHHILVYLCAAPLPDAEVGVSMPCNALPENVSACRSGLLVGAWAVGGEDFIYPEEVAYPIGGNSQELFIVMEMHYDNPNNINGVVDNSGMRFYYTTEEPRQRAGILEVGHMVTQSMLIPPRTGNYTIAGVCSSDCTQQSIPEGGIMIFANLLHTHIVGQGVVLEHYRYNPDCDVIEELEPIDANLNYDFNFQQFTQLQKVHVVLPGDILLLKCYYNTSAVSTFTIGGQSTLEEMCLAFPVYYPRPADGNILSRCLSTPTSTSFTNFYLYLNGTNPAAAAELIKPHPAPIIALSGLDWQGNPQLAKELQDSILKSAVLDICLKEDGGLTLENVIAPESKCPYLAPDRCTNSESQTCCERLTAGALPGGVHLSMVIASLMVTLSLLLANV